MNANANIVNIVKDYLTHPLRAKIADAINSDITLTNSAIDGAIPGLLSSFLRLSTNPTRSTALFITVSNQNGAILNSFDETLSSTNNYIQLTNTGSNILTNTMGSTSSNDLASATSSHSGLGKSTSSSLLGLLAPVTLGLLKQQLLNSGDFSSRNLMNLLNWQRDNIYSVLPYSFIDIDEKEASYDANRNTLKTANHHSNKAKTTTFNNQEPTESSFLLTKVMPLFLFSCVLLLTYTLLYSKNNNPEVNATSTSLTQIQEIHPSPRNITEIATAEQFQTTNLQSKKIENEITQRLQEELQDSIDYIASILASINNVSSADTAVEEIAKATVRIEELIQSANALPDSLKKLLAEQVNNSIPRLQALTQNADNIPEVGDIIKPTIQDLATSLTKFL